jgi:formylglycine-generating enzyme required for sulfatase activity
VGKPEFTPPELHGKDFALLERTRQHDSFGLAVLLFQLLMEGTHPFDGVYPKGTEPLELENRIAAGHFPHGNLGRCPMRPKPIAPPFEMLDPALQRLFLQCFVNGHAHPIERPDAGTWRSALAQAAQTLRRCLVNPQHRYWGHMACPWCERTGQLGGMDPFPSVQAVKKRQHLDQQSTGARTPMAVPVRRIPVKAVPMARPRPGVGTRPTARAPVRMRTTVRSRPTITSTKLHWWWMGWAVFVIIKAVFSINEPSHLSTVPSLPSSISGAWKSTPRRSAGQFANLASLTDNVEEEKSFRNSTGGQMVWIPPGNFRMGDMEGDGEANEKPVHDVRISAGYWLGETAVTQAQWEDVMGKNQSYFKGADLPVENVSWDDAVAFCTKLSAREHDSGRLPWRIEYRLPTEAQWEYACRAGTTVDYANALPATAWSDTNSDGRTHEVAKKQANAWGLYDMHGNVGQWCADWYAGYRAGLDVDPTGPWEGLQRVARGGSWDLGSRSCRSATRFAIAPDSASSHVGFRLAAVVSRR